MPNKKWINDGPYLSAPNPGPHVITRENAMKHGINVADRVQWVACFLKSELWGKTTLQLQQITGIMTRSVLKWRRYLRIKDTLGRVKRMREINKQGPPLQLVEK